jgi:enamine deaminase RidA (YjgF/YER057c/UK114 family)
MIDYFGKKENNSQVVSFSGLLFLSGVTASDKTGSIVAQTRLVLQTIEERLRACGSDKSHLLASTVFLADLAMKEEMNRVWIDWIDSARPPARTCVGAILTPRTLIEVSVIACKA